MKKLLLTLAVTGLVLVGCSTQSQSQPNFTLSLNPDNASVSPDQPASTTLTLTPQNGFSGTVNLSLQNPRRASRSHPAPSR